ncbi:STAS domain-containing protein [Streptomyces sp. NPDC051776]|uniref:STAS domain-containing protein n=1 Tax=Streptomyces sp. NPDC051776 TaxID=3155414 RepID=UPI003437315D
MGRDPCGIGASVALGTTLTLVWTTAHPARWRTGPQGAAVVYLRGEISASNADQARRQITAALATPPASLELHLAKVTLLTRDGAQGFLTAARIAHEQGIDVTIHNPSPQARTTLRDLDLERFLTYRDK